MDNSPSPNPLPLFRFSEAQQELLFEMAQQLTIVLSDFRFNDPEKDHSLIRQHAAMSGKRDALLQLLAHDEQVTKQANDNLAALMNSESTLDSTNEG